MANSNEINNSFYDQYGEKWYTADDDPVALLRAENKLKTPWVLQRIKTSSKVLDVGCGAGFLANDLSIHGHEVTGVDLSEESLKVAQAHDATKRVEYLSADAYKLPFADHTFDVVTAMDFLEHIDDPARAIKEFSRVLKPGGIFFFHTFNRNALAWLIIIKMVEWLLPKTPKNMHVLKLFIKPEELKKYCQDSQIMVDELTGIKPVFKSIPVKSIFSRRVPKDMAFELTGNLWLSYMGMGTKNG